MSAKTPRILSRSIATLAAAGVLAIGCTTQAATLYWDNVGGTANDWGAVANWSTDIGGGVTPGAIPGTGDIASFAATSVVAAQTVNLNADRSVLGLEFMSSQTHTLQAGGTNRVLTLGASGITMNAGAAAATIGSGTANQNVSITLGAAQTWTNNSTSLLTIVNGVTNGANLLTVTGTGNTTISGVIGSGAGGLTKTGTGTLTLSGANTYTGATSVLGGTLILTAAAPSGAAGTLGNAASAVLVGDTTGAVDASLLTSAAVTIARALNVQAGNTGNITIGGSGANAATFSGAVTLNKDANFTAVASGTTTFSGIVSGSGALTKTGAGTVILSGNNTFSGGTTIANGVLQVNSANALGTGGVTIAAGAATANRLLINGGVTIGNNINFGNTLGAVGTGVLQQAGTGQGRINGTLTITGSPSAGGHFVGGATVGNELVLAGAINSTVATLTQRSGRVVYGGGGTGGSWTSLGVTGTALVGATNGIPTNVAVTLGVSEAAALDLNGFDQQLAGLTLGNTGSSFAGTVSLGAKTLTLTGDIVSITGTSLNAAHVINATAGGAIDVGASGRTINLPDSQATDDLSINDAAINGSGGIVKQGSGTLALNGVTVAGPLAINAGTLQAGTSTAVGSLTANGLTFGPGGTGLKIKAGASGDIINAGQLVTNGITTLSVNQVGGILPNGTYPLINYTGASPGLSGFVLNAVGHSTSTLIDTGTAIALSVTGNDRVIWDGTNSTAWTTGATGNWKLATPLTPTDFIEGDDVIFQDSPTSSAVSIATNVSPSKVTFTNTAATSYTITGAGGIIGLTGLTKTGNGTLTLSNPNSYSGTTSVQAGTLVADYTTVNPLGTLTTLDVAAGATAKLSHAGGILNLVNTLTGAGTVVIDPSTTTAGNRDIATITWDTSGFTGTLNLKPTTGTMRLQVNSTDDVGNGTVRVDAGGQIFVSVAGLTFDNDFTLSGTGFSEGAGTLGALRSHTTTYDGVFTINGTAKIGALGQTATFTNALTGGTLTFGGSINNAGSETLLLTGDASGLAGLVVNDASGTSNAATILFSVGNNGTTGNLGAVPVTLQGDGFKTAVLRFDRTDGYSLGAGITSNSPTAANNARTQVQIDTRGTGFDTNGQTINLGAVSTGGQFRVGNVRTGSIATVNGSLTGGGILVSAGAANATLNLAFGANAAANNVTIGVGGTGGVLNIATGATLAVTSNFHLGEAANNSATVNQSGGTTTVGGQLRIGHFATETSTYNMTGGSLTVAPGGTFPYSTGVAEVNGGIYAGIDGAGILNHSGGVITTGFLVLDNRGDTGAGANMPTGVDTYTLSGTGTLVLSSQFGIITRNASTAIFLNGGTIQAGSGISPNLDTTKINVGGSVAIDTNGVNTFTLYGPLSGAGTLNLTGGGTFRTQDSTGTTTTAIGGVGAGIGGSLGAVSFSIGNGSTLLANRTGLDQWSGAISGTGTLTKQNTGTLTLSGNSSAFTGAVNVNAGRLDLPANFGAASITVADGATLSGEPAIATVTLGSATGSSLFFDPSTAGALTATNLTVNGTTSVDFSTVPTGPGAVTVLNYTNKAGAGTFALANAANYRSQTVTDTGSAITLAVTTKALTWTGTGGAAWDINTTTNWNDSTPAPEKFFAGDTVTFGDGPTQVAVTVTSGVSPWKTTVNSNTANYTFNSTTNGISGPGNLEKSGNSILTLVGPNTYSGKTIVTGGVLSFPASNSLGNGGTGNTIVLGGGARLNYTASAAVDFGANRNILVDTGGGTISHSNGTAATLSIPGKISGSGDLAFTSTAAGAGTFNLTGDNSGYTGNISVSAQSTGLTALSLANQAAVPTSGTITLNYPAAGASGNATTLSIPGGITLPATLGIALTSFQNGGTSLRTQINTTGDVTINGPISVSGGAIVQLQPATAGGTLSLNGDISEGVGGFTGTFFTRSNGTVVVNGTVNLPNAAFSHTDAGIVLVNSTGNVWATSAIVSSGILRIGADNALPITAPLQVGQASDASNSTFDLNGFDQELPSLIYVAGSGNSTRGITNTSATLSTLTINNAANVSYGASTGVTGGIIASNVHLVKTGPGTLTLGGTNTFTGATQVNAGILKLGGATSPLGAATSTVTVADGATIDAGGFTPTTKVPLVIQGAGVGGNGALISTAAGAVNTTFFSSIDFTGGDLTYNSGTARYDFFGAAGATINGGTNTLTKLGTSESWWSPAPGASVGSILVNEGVFGVQSSNNLGSLAHSLVVNSGAQIQTFNAISNSKPVVINGGQLASNNNTSTWNGTVTLAGAGITNKVGTVTAGVGVVFNGQVSGNGFEKIGNGTLTLGSSANDYAGDMRVTAGTLTVSGSGRFSPDSRLEMNGGTADLNGTTQTVSGLLGATGIVTSSAAASLTVNQLADTTYGGSLAGAVSLIKEGAASLTLSGVSSTSGAVAVNAGTLIVDGTLSGSTVSVNGGTLKGIGTVASLVGNSGGSIAPGDSPGVLAVANDFSLHSNAHLSLELNGLTAGTQYDRLTVGGNVTLGGDLAGSTLGFSPAMNDVFYVIINNGANPVSGLLNGVADGGLLVIGGVSFFVSYDADSVLGGLGGFDTGGNDVALKAVPEPGSALGIAAGLTMLAGLRRFRRRI